MPLSSFSIKVYDVFDFANLLYDKQYTLKKLVRLLKCKTTSKRIKFSDTKLEFIRREHDILVEIYNKRLESNAEFERRQAAIKESEYNSKYKKTIGKALEILNRHGYTVFKGCKKVEKE